MLRILIIEDELPNAENIKAHLSRFDPGAKICGILQSNKEIVAWFAENAQPDLVFCDIKLLDGNVFISLQKGLVSCPIIFTTAYNTFYQDAFDANGIAYLLKPIGYQRFSDAMHKYFALRQSFQVKDWNRISDIVGQIQTSYRERIIVKFKTGSSILELNQVACIVTQDGKCVALDNKGKKHVFRCKISELHAEINPKKFFLINRGEIVNIDYIEHLEPYFGDRLAIKVKHNPTRMITSTSATPAFRKWVDR